MRIRVRRLVKFAPGVRARANAKRTSVVRGGKGYIALVMLALALALAACSGGGPSPSPAGTSPAGSPSTTGTGSACVTSSPTGTCPGAHDYTTGSTNSNGYNTYLANNCWGDPNCQQTLSANSFGDWRVTADEPAGNGSVRNRPRRAAAVQQLVSWQQHMGQPGHERLRKP